MKLDFWLGLWWLNVASGNILWKFKIENWDTGLLFGLGKELQY